MPSGKKIDLLIGAKKRNYLFFLAGPSSVEVTDLDSTNGTYVEGEECEGDKPQVLKVGGEVVFGALHIT